LLPILSTFFFLLPPFYSTHETSKGNDHQIIVTLITIILWLGEGLLWMLIGLNFIDLIVWLIYLISQNYDVAVLARMITIFFFALLWLTLIITNAEYHFKHLGRSKSWKAFGRTLLFSGIVYLISMLILQV